MPTQISGLTGVDQIQNGAVSSTAKIADGVVTPVKTQVSALPSMVRVNTANGYGSTNNKIRRFTNIVTNQGLDITYSDSATLGAAFTINAAGVYAISYSDSFGISEDLGVSLNSSQLVTSILAINAADRACNSQTAAASFHGSCSTSLFIAAGGVIRPHTGGSATGTVNASNFTITRVA